MDNEDDYDKHLVDELVKLASDNSDIKLLQLNYQGLKSVPSIILRDQRFSKVERIHLKRNLLQTLPDGINRLRNLVEIYLHSNGLVQLPETIGNLFSLEILDTSSNNLTCLPPSIGALKNLKKLYLTHNLLKFLPNEIGKLERLQVLEAASNQLGYLTPEISRCYSLKRLLLDRNKLQCLPRELCHMISLEELSVTGNSLLYIPLDLGYIPNLKSVYVDNNPLLHAVPVSLSSVRQFGFNSCGIKNANYKEFNDDQLYLTVQKPVENQTNIICLPRELQKIGTHKSLPPLLELTLRKCFQHRKAIAGNDIPCALYQLLLTPIASCLQCGTPIFTMAYPVVFDGYLHDFKLYRLGLCCSSKCVKLTELLSINYCLLYPEHMW